MRPSPKPTRLAALLLAGTLAAPLPATTARAADAAGADRLRDTLESYLGHPAPGAPSAVTVTVVGGDYDLAIDFDRLATPLHENGLDLKLGRHLSRLTPKPDGTWAWRSDRFEPITWAFQGRSGGVVVDGWRAEGEFSPALGSFTRQTITADRVLVDQKEPATGGAPRLDVRRIDEGLAVNVAAKPAAAGTGVDLTLDQTSRSMTETFTFSDGKAAGMPDMQATLKVGPSRLSAAWTGLRTPALLGLWRHLVAHHAPADFTTGQATFKTVVRDLGPVFDRLDQRIGIDAMEIETPFGFGSIGRLEARIEATGATPDGTADVSTTLTGLQIHSLFIPAWANRLIPADLTVRAKVTGWDAASGLKTFLDRADFAAEKPLDDAASAAVVAALLPTGSVTIDLTGNRVKATDWTVGLDGRLVTRAGGVDGEITIEARGLEAAASALRDPAAGEQGAAAAAQLALALSFAETRDGVSSWRFGFHGSEVTVNGRSLGPNPTAQ